MSVAMNECAASSAPTDYCSDSVGFSRNSGADGSACRACDDDERTQAAREARDRAFSSIGRNLKLCGFSEKLEREIQKKAERRAARREDPANYWNQMSYKAHRRRVKNARPQIDTTGPCVSKGLFVNARYNQRLLEFARIEKENTIMLQHLAEIIHGKASIDNKLDDRYPKRINVRGQDRQLELLRITFDNLSLLKRIQSQRPFYSRKEQLANYEKHEKVMAEMSLYPLYWQIDKECKWGPLALKAKENAIRNPKPKVFLTLGNSTQVFGKLLIELFATQCPMTAENFRGLCTGEYGPTYKCSQIHRILKDILWQGGDVTGQGGSGNRSIYGDTFPDENFTVKHDKPGIITMANCGPDTNGSQFIIIAKKLSVLDGTNVAFGKVVGGMGVLQQISNKVTSSGRPRQKVFVVECGELDADADLSEYEDADVDEGSAEDGGSVTETQENTTVSEASSTKVKTDGDESVEVQ